MYNLYLVSNLAVHGYNKSIKLYLLT